MCIACELGFLIAMDELPNAPPPGFPRGPSRDGGEFTCDAPPTDTQPALAAKPGKSERKS